MGDIMADDIHHKHPLKLEHVQTIIGRLMIDESFRDQFHKDLDGTLASLGIHAQDDTEKDNDAYDLMKKIQGILKDTQERKTEDLMKDLRAAYLASSDGVIRPRCM